MLLPRFRLSQRQPKSRGLHNAISETGAKRKLFRTFDVDRNTESICRYGWNNLTERAGGEIDGRI